ncbi:MAG: hypothetical protein ABJM43_09660 [Paracoccaceae bacterium]
MKSFVHIGAPKTGSTSIQTFLHENTGALARKGFRYHVNVKGRGSQWEYPMAANHVEGCLLNPAQRSRYHANTLEEQAERVKKHLAALRKFPIRWQEPTALFSSEHILPWLKSANLVNAMDTIFSDVFSEVHYILYLRNPADLIVSQYSERVKRGSSFTFDQFFERRLPGLDHYAVVKRWHDVVGPDRISVRLLDRDFLINGDLIDDYSAQCGINVEGLKRPPRENEALTAAGAEALRALNQRIPELDSNGRYNPLRNDLLRAVMQASENMPPLALFPRHQKKLENATAASMEKLRSELFPERPVLFTSRKHGQSITKLIDIRERALDIVAKVIVDLRMEEISPLTRRQKAKAVAYSPDLSVNEKS